MLKLPSSAIRGAIVSISTSGQTIAASLPPLPRLALTGYRRTKYSDSQFQRDTLQRWGRSCHDLLSSSGRSSERDLGNIWMRRHPRPQVVVASQGLNNTRREELLCQLHQLKAGVRGVWPGPGQIRNHIIEQGLQDLRGFDDDGVAS